MHKKRGGRKSKEEYIEYYDLCFYLKVFFAIAFASLASLEAGIKQFPVAKGSLDLRSCMLCRRLHLIGDQA